MTRARTAPPGTGKQTSQLADLNAQAKALAGSNAADLQDPTTSNFGIYAGTPIPGARELFGGALYSQTPLPQGKDVFGQKHGPTPGLVSDALGDYQAQDVLENFKGLSGPKLANIQMLLYRAGGFYPAGQPPTSHLGHLTLEDINAFQTFLLGFAVNPQQKDAQGNRLGLNGYAQQLAQQGDETGVNLRNKAPNVIHLTNPDDLRTVLQKGAQALYGGYLPDDQVNKFIAGYQAQETATKTAAYNAGEGNLGTAGGSTTVTDPTSLPNAAETFIRSNFPNQVAATEFGSAMDQMLAGLRRPG